MRYREESAASHVRVERGMWGPLCGLGSDILSGVVAMNRFGIHAIKAKTAVRSKIISESRGDWEMIEEEVGADVFAAGKSNGKLQLLEKWLYGSETLVRPRLAPSIIARSEAELLGISSPRFAIRVYVGRNSFVNIRRRKITVYQIRNTHSEEIADALLASNNANKGHSVRADESQVRSMNWIADCLLEPPPRLLQQRFQILTCTLGADYGEDRIHTATPFVTHISIGGGLCAQAAVFMALCLMEETEIFGISEITCLAAEDRNHFEIHGLKPLTIERFLTDSANLSAQLQCVSNPTLANEQDTTIETIRCALRGYIENRIPILLMLSSSRMQGLGPGDKAPPEGSNPILRSSEKSVVNDLLLPLGTKLDYLDSAVVDRSDLQNDYHCVVIVGCNDDASYFLINDPGTMPFVKATVEQLFHARSYKSYQMASPDQRRRYSIDPVGEADLGEFQFISVCPKGVNLPLLRLATQQPQVGGLINAIQPVRHQMDYPPTAFAWPAIRMHLGRWSGSDMDFRSGLVLDKAAIGLISASGLVPDRWYWVSEIASPDRHRKYSRSFGFWDASHSISDLKGQRRSVDQELVCVLGQRTDDNGWQMTYSREAAS